MFKDRLLCFNKWYRFEMKMIFVIEINSNPNRLEKGKDGSKSSDQFI